MGCQARGLATKSIDLNALTGIKKRPAPSDLVSGVLKAGGRLLIFRIQIPRARTFSKKRTMSIQETLKQKLRDAVAKLFDITIVEFTVEVPPRADLGDLAFPLPFELAKKLKAETGQKQNPRDIAAKLAAEIQGVAGVSKVQTAGAGYLNVFFDRAAYLRAALAGDEKIEPMLGGKIIVEHTAVNPNKAAHIGHLRNAVLGDTTARLLRAAGEEVEVQNYIDNTGVQVADVVVGFKYLEGKTVEQVKAIEGKFDYYCWDLYSSVGAFYEEDKSRLELRATTLHELESGSGETYELADYISTRVLNCHLDTLLRFDVKYDLLPRESDVLHLHIWQRAFDLLKEQRVIEFETDGRLAGCWVMRSGDQDAEDAEGEHEADKVIVRSNGTVTYTGKDIAFHLWKLGKLDIDFYYKPFRVYADGSLAWITTSNPLENDPSHPRFGNGAAYFNVIDIGQSYPQQYVKLGVMAASSDKRVERSAHLAYEKVALSPAAAEQLGQSLSDEDKKRGAVSMSGRKGLGVKVDDLIDQLESNARVEVSKRHPDLTEGENAEAAHKIAAGALRYFLLKYTRTSVISFDFKEALSFEGETGPYVQYSPVRINSLLRKLKDSGIDIDTGELTTASMSAINELLSGDGDELWSLAYFASRFPEVVRSAVSSLEPAHIAKWAFQLAKNYSLFYEKHHVLTEADPVRRALLIAITMLVQRKLIAALDIIGIEVPERM